MFGGLGMDSGLQGYLELPQVKDDDHASQEQHDAQGQEELLSLEICF